MIDKLTDQEMFKMLWLIKLNFIINENTDIWISVSRISVSWTILDMRGFSVEAY